MWQVQTPQVFDAALILSAYEKLMQEKEKLLENIAIPVRHTRTLVSLPAAAHCRRKPVVHGIVPLFSPRHDITSM